MSSPSGNGAPAKIRVERESDRDIKIRDLYITIDDEAERNLPFGASFEMPLTPGKHRIKATNRLFKQVATFQASPGETISFEAINVQRIGILNVLAIVSGGLVYRPVLKRI